MARRCPTCNQRQYTADERLVGELTPLVLTLVPLAVALLIGHVPLWLKIWGGIGIGFNVFSWLYFAARGASVSSETQGDSTTSTTARITGIERSTDRR